MRKHPLIILFTSVFLLVGLASEVSLWHYYEFAKGNERTVPPEAHIGYRYNKFSVILLDRFPSGVAPGYGIWRFECMAMVQFLVIATSVSASMLCLLGIRMLQPGKPSA